MNTLDELAATSTEQRRIELAKLLAAGVIRLLLQRQGHIEIDTGNPGGNSPDGLDGK